MHLTLPYPRNLLFWIIVSSVEFLKLPQAVTDEFRYEVQAFWTELKDKIR